MKAKNIVEAIHGDVERWSHERGGRSYTAELSVSASDKSRSLDLKRKGSSTLEYWCEGMVDQEKLLKRVRK